MRVMRELVIINIMTLSKLISLLFEEPFVELFEELRLFIIFKVEFGILIIYFLNLF